MLQRTLRLYQSSFAGLSKEVWLLSIVLLINRSGSMVIPFLTVYLTGQRGFSLQDAGMVMSSYGLGSVAGSYIGGWFTDRNGFYRVQFWTLIGSGLAFWGVAGLESLPAMCAGIFVLSAVTDALRPANQAAIAYFSEPANLSRSYGLLRLAINLGFSIGPVMGGWLIAGFGYYTLFWVNGIAAIAAAFAYKISFPKRIIALAPNKKAESDAGEPEPADLAAAPERSAYRDPVFLLFVVLVCLQATVFMQFFGSLPVYLQQNWGYTEAQIGNLIALNGLLIVAVEMPLVHLAGERYGVLPIIAFGSLLVGLSYLLLGVAGAGLLAATTFIVIITFGEMLSMPFMNTWVASRAPFRRRGEYMGLQSIAWAVAFIIAPSLGLRWAAHWNFDSLWVFMGGVGVASALGFWLMRGR
jgi:MFS family permease